MVDERGLRSSAVLADARIALCARAHGPTDRVERLTWYFQIEYGRRERIRTSGPYVPNVVLYQAELLSDKSDGLLAGLAGAPL